MDKDIPEPASEAVPPAPEVDTTPPAPKTETTPPPPAATAPAPAATPVSPFPQTNTAPSLPEKNLHKHYLIKWKVVLNMQINGMERNFHGWLGDISTESATAYIENNLPVNAQLLAIFLIPPRIAHGQPQAVQVKCKSTYCVLGNNGMFRAGIKFNSFLDNGQAVLEKELAEHIPLQAH
jgi:hypothetical protein